MYVGRKSEPTYKSSLGLGGILRCSNGNGHPLVEEVGRHNDEHRKEVAIDHV